MEVSMHITKKGLHLSFFLTLVLGLTFALTSCNSSSIETTIATPTAESSSDAKEESQPINKTTSEGGVFKLISSDPPTLDPHLASDATSATMIVEIFGGLVTINPDLEVVGDIAKNWEISLDRLTYTFFLREHAVFHNGKPVTAHDFKWSLERACDTLTESLVAEQYLGDIVGVKAKLRGKARDIKGVRVIDDHTLQITIDQPKTYFLAKLTYPTAFVVDKNNVEEGKRWTRNPNGTGPFKLKEYTPGELMVLGSNPEYHLGAPHISEVRYLLSGGTSMLMYENDELDIAGVGLADMDRLLDPSNPLNKELHKAPPSFSTTYIGLNNNDPPFDDPKVRQALNFAINRQEIASLVLADLVHPAKGILPPGFPAYNSSLPGYEYNPEKARQLLKESTYGDDTNKYPPIMLTKAGGFGAAVSLDLEVILESWRQELGLEISIQQTEFASYLQDLHKRRFQMFDIGWIADYPDPENFLDLLFHSTSDNNHTNYNNPIVDDLLVQARTETETEKRYQLYQEAERLILYDSPWIPLWHSGEQYILLKPWVKNYNMSQLIVPKLRFIYFD
ncbi:peptide ABC transporter substrate-binding protein [SAR202 cluster bacterium AC-409-J13_OGT_754m]|nr:peptide ABC transporter substrate-binding protein [SAR202 cluster bacterium AC-409-J13_OGT_754m]